MLARSKCSAMIIAIVEGLVYAVAYLLVVLANHYQSHGSLPPIQAELNAMSSWAMAAIAVLIIIGIIAFGAFVIYKLKDDVYYGLGGLLRWICLAFFCGFVSGLTGLIEETSPVVETLKSLVGLIIFLAAYQVIFKVLPSSARKKA